MHRMIMRIGVAALACSAWANDLRVGSYNIRTQFADKGTENAWNVRKADLAARIRQLDYDGVGLQ